MVKSNMTVREGYRNCGEGIEFRAVLKSGLHRAKGTNSAKENGGMTSSVPVKDRTLPSLSRRSKTISSGV